MAELQYIADPKGIFSYLDFGDTEAGTNSLGYPVGTTIYRALLTQTGTNAPVATVLANTLGFTVIWSYNGPGVYLGTGSVAGGFPVNKTMVFCGEGQTLDNWTTDGKLATAQLFQDDAIRVESGASGAPANDLLFDTPIEVVVYP